VLAALLTGGLGVLPAEDIYPEPREGAGQDAEFIKGQGHGSLLRRWRAVGEFIWNIWALFSLASLVG